MGAGANCPNRGPPIFATALVKGSLKIDGDPMVREVRPFKLQIRPADWMPDDQDWADVPAETPVQVLYEGELRMGKFMRKRSNGSLEISIDGDDEKQ